MTSLRKEGGGSTFSYKYWQYEKRIHDSLNMCNVNTFQYYRIRMWLEHTSVKHSDKYAQWQVSL